jgi:membrane protein implicated in regulation of membrane protease activity
MIGPARVYRTTTPPEPAAPFAEVEMFENTGTIWFLAGLVLILMEFVVPGVILVFFGAGAWIAAVTTWLGWTDSLAGQVGVFAVSSLVLLFTLRRTIRAQFTGHVSKGDIPDLDRDEFVGQVVRVTADVVPGRRDGKVEFKGATWAAVSDRAFAAGDAVRVVAVDGLTLTVGPVEGGE